MAELTNEQKKAWAKNALHPRDAYAGGNSRACGGFTGDCEQLDRQRKLGAVEGFHNHHTGGAAEEPVPAAGGTQQRHHGKTGRGTVPERRGSGHHFQTVERHQETGNRSGAGGHHLRVLRPAQMGADLRFHAGEGDHPASGRVCQIKIILTWQRKRLTTQDRLALDSWNELVASVRENIRTSTPRTRKRKSGRKKAGEERRGVVQILLRHVLHLRVPPPSTGATSGIMAQQRAAAISNSAGQRPASAPALHGQSRREPAYHTGLRNAEKPGAWETGEFTCQSGCSFRAIGAGQSPRGTRNKNFRPDCILIDDIDTDEECRNPERIRPNGSGWKRR